MTISDARAFIRPLAAANASTNDVFSHQGLVDVYWSSDEAIRASIRVATELLLFEGVDWERQMAAQFFSTIGAPEDVLQRAAERYSRSPDEALETLLRDGWASANAETVDILRKLFLRDPVRYARVAKAVLHAEPDGDAWQQVVAIVNGADDARTLYDAFELAFVANRGDDFLALVRGKPDLVIRRLGKLMTADWESKLLAAARLS